MHTPPLERNNRRRCAAWYANFVDVDCTLRPDYPEFPIKSRLVSFTDRLLPVPLSASPDGRVERALTAIHLGPPDAPRAPDTILQLKSLPPIAWKDAQVALPKQLTPYHC